MNIDQKIALDILTNIGYYVELAKQNVNEEKWAYAAYNMQDILAIASKGQAVCLRKDWEVKK